MVAFFKTVVKGIAMVNNNQSLYRNKIEGAISLPVKLMSNYVTFNL